MYSSSTSIRVRYAETDQMGYVYYGHYALYYEVGRVDCLRQLGVSYRSLEEQGIMLPVVDSYYQYLKPARYDELLRINTRISQAPSVRIAFDYELYNEQEQLINRGKTTLVFVDRKTGRPCRVPAMLEDLLLPYFQ